jgi:hypothetical protein
MSAQTSYSNAPTRGFAGALADNGPKDFLSRTNGNASAEIPFGIGVIFGTTDGTAKTPAAVTDKVVGVVAHSHAYQPGAQLGTTGVAALGDLNVLRKGRIYLVAEQDVVPGDRLFCRAVSGAGGTVLGAWRKAHVAAETIDTSTQVQVLSTAVAGSVFVAEVNFVAESIRDIVAKLSAAITAADGTGTVATFKSTILTQLALLV